MTSTTINRKDYRKTACVDWVRVVVTLARASQFRHVQAALYESTGETLYVEPLDSNEKAGGNATVFKITLHDRLANNAPTLNAAIDRLRELYGFAAEPTINAIEVAIDFFWRGCNNTQPAGLLAMTLGLQGALYVPDAINPRQFVPNGQINAKGRADGNNRYLDNEGDRLDPNQNFRIGNEWDDLSWQIYFKTVDRANTPIQNRKLWRSRVEATIQGAALQRFGLNSLADLDGYKFDRLTPLFKFRRPTEPLTQAKGNRFVWFSIITIRRIRDATPLRGIHSFAVIGRRDKRGNTRAESKHIEVEPMLTGACKDALKRLSI